MRVKLNGITKRFGTLKALNQVSLLIEEGKFFTLLGPSGCGKTTLLRLIAGFTLPDSGEIFFDDQPIHHLPPYKRETGMVFQNYALFPHLNIFSNVAYGLRARKIPNDEIRSRVHEVLEKVQLENLARRFPGQLSGGQQQRVALARALVIHPRVLLMDEPLSNLDAKLRVAMRQEIRKIQKDLGITTVYVTHDQEEAMAISDTIAIFSRGEVEQVGTPSEIYFRPRNRFVAEFTGTSNLVEVEVIAYDPQARLLRGDLKGNQISVRCPQKPFGKTVTILLRPEWIKIIRDEKEQASNVFCGQVLSSTFIGFMLKYQVNAFGNQVLAIEVQDPEEHEVKKEGDPLYFWFRPDRPIVLFP